MGVHRFSSAHANALFAANPCALLAPAGQLNEIPLQLLRQRAQPSGKPQPMQVYHPLAGLHTHTHIASSNAGNPELYNWVVWFQTSSNSLTHVMGVHRSSSAHVNALFAANPCALLAPAGQLNEIPLQLLRQRAQPSGKPQPMQVYHPLAGLHTRTPIRSRNRSHLAIRAIQSFTTGSCGSRLHQTH